MSNNAVWRKIRKFPEYEVSANHLIRNIKHKRIVPQRTNPYDRERKAKVILMRGLYPVEAFVQEIVYDNFPEQRESMKKEAA